MVRFHRTFQESPIPATQLTFIELRLLEVAIALATNPNSILLDKPMARFSLAEIDEAVKLVQRIREELGIIIWVVHVLRAIMKVAEREVALDRRCRIAEDTYQRIASDLRVIAAYIADSS